MTVPAPTTSPLARRYRLDEFFALDEPADHSHWELIAGVLYMVPPPGGSHHLSASRLTVLFAAYASAHPDVATLFVPRASIWTSDDTFLEPDLFLVATDRLRTADAGELRSADLVVEIHAAEGRRYDRTTKADTYAVLGVGELWLVDLERRTIEQRVLADGSWRVVGTFAGDEDVRAVVFPGLVVRAGAVFG